jgi:hypothetical protein
LSRGAVEEVRFRVAREVGGLRIIKNWALDLFSC